jgi:hypothetical protein
MNISFLLGAGFSRLIGLPTASELSEYIASITAEYLLIFDDLSIGLTNQNERIKPFYVNKDIHSKYFLEFSIKFYKYQMGSFDNYEVFVDFFEHLKNDSYKSLKEFIKSFETVDNLDSICNDNSKSNALRYLENLIEGKLTLRPEHLENLYKYKFFTDFIYRTLQKNIVNVFTLNHDLLVEFLSSTLLYGIPLNDGFTLKDSAYRAYNSNISLNQKLHYFNSDFDSNFNLIKLHGSIDLVPINVNPKGFVKKPQGVSLNELNVFNGVNWINDFSNEKSLFLTGVTRKERFYKSDYFKTLLEVFKRKNKESNFLIIIGYSGLDKRINEVLQETLNPDCKLYIIDPMPNSDFIENFKNYKPVVISEGFSNESLNQIKL